MFRFVTPHLSLESVVQLKVDQLHALGLSGLLLDLDCTLKDYRAATIPTEVVAWVIALKANGFRLCLLSNGGPRKVGRFADALDVPFISKAFKPFPHGCRAGLKRLGLEREQVGLVGDQIFADVLAGRLAGLITILVRPTSPDEPWFTRLKRPLERQFLRWAVPGSCRPGREQTQSPTD